MLPRYSSELTVLINSAYRPIRKAVVDGTLSVEEGKKALRRLHLRVYKDTLPKLWMKWKAAVWAQEEHKFWEELEREAYAEDREK